MTIQESTGINVEQIQGKKRRCGWKGTRRDGKYFTRATNMVPVLMRKEIKRWKTRDMLVME